MLDKIKDLRLNLNGSRTEYYIGQYKKNGNMKKDSHYTDTLNCSESIQFIMQKKWQIKELSYLSGNRISISFLISGIEFHTVIEIGELNFVSKIDYSISSEKEEDNNKKKLAAFITMDICEEDLNYKSSESELPGIKMLLKRLFSLNIESELNTDDSSVLDNIFDDITDFIAYDMAYINGSLFEFLAKLTGCKVNIPEKNTFTSISLKKITSEKA